MAAYVKRVKINQVYFHFFKLISLLVGADLLSVGTFVVCPQENGTAFFCLPDSKIHEET